MPAVEKMGGGKKKAKSMKRKNSIAEPAMDVVSPEKKTKNDKETPANKKKSLTKKIPGKTAPKEALPEKPKKTNQEVVKENKTSPKKAKVKNKKDNQITAVNKEVSTKEENLPVKEKGQRKKKMKSAERKNPQVKEASRDNSTEAASPDSVPLKGDLLSIYRKRRAARNARCFRVIIRTFEDDDEEEEVEFENAACVRSLNNGFYFVSYKSEEVAEKMKKELEERDDVIVVNRMQKEVNNDDVFVNPYRLFIENLPADTTLEDVEKEFPTATEVIHMPNRSLVHMIYDSKEEAEKVFRESEDIEIHGAKMTVLYVNNKPKRNWRKEKLKKIKAVKAKKKQKKLKKLQGEQ